MSPMERESAAAVLHFQLLRFRVSRNHQQAHGGTLVDVVAAAGVVCLWRFQDSGTWTVFGFAYGENISDSYKRLVKNVRCTFLCHFVILWNFFVRCCEGYFVDVRNVTFVLSKNDVSSLGANSCGLCVTLQLYFNVDVHV